MPWTIVEFHIGKFPQRAEEFIWYNKQSDWPEVWTNSGGDWMIAELSLLEGPDCPLSCGWSFTAISARTAGGFDILLSPKIHL